RDQLRRREAGRAEQHPRRPCPEPPRRDQGPGLVSTESRREPWNPVGSSKPDIALHRESPEAQYRASSFLRFRRPAPEAKNRIDGLEGVFQPDLLSFLIRSSVIRDRHFVDARPHGGHLLRDLGLDAEIA